MPEVLVEVSRGEGAAMAWSKSLSLPAAEAAKVAEWLDKILPEVVVQARAGVSYRIKASVKG